MNADFSGANAHNFRCIVALRRSRFNVLEMGDLLSDIILTDLWFIVYPSVIVGDFNIPLS